MTGQGIHDRGRAGTRATRVLAALGCAAALSACDSGVVELVTGSHSMGDLQTYANQVLARKGGKIEELPPVEPYVSYAYQSVEGTDPFEPFFRPPPPPPPPEQGGGEGSGVRPPANHPPEELETYPLDALRMMGTLENSEELWGIVRSPDGTIHRVRPGNYLGKNYGKITAITEASIELLEIIPDGQGGWTEREAQLALVEE